MKIKISKKALRARRSSSRVENSTDKLLRIIRGSGESPNRQELGAIRRMSELSQYEDYDVAEQYRRLQKTYRQRMIQRRRTIVLGSAASIAAVLVVCFLTFQKFGPFWSAPILNESKVDAIATNTMMEDENGVLITLRNGRVVNISEALEDETSGSTEDLRKIEREDKTVSISEYSTIVVPKSHVYQLYLDDGSLLTFNSDSKVRFPNEFSSLERRIIIDYGEVFVQVVRDPSRPFIAEVKGSEIEVLGTSFNVHAYPESPVSTTLVTGHIKFVHGDKSVSIIPGQQAVVHNDGIIVNDANIADITAWTRGLFVFEDMDLKRIMAQLSRWYDFEVVFDTPELLGFRFTGVLDKKYERDYVFSLLQMTTDIAFYSGEDGIVHVGKRGRN